jgi:DNA-binding XRE family transcriptional regulator
MLAVVKTPHIDVRIQGEISPFMMEVLKKEYGRKLRLEADDESVDYFETDQAKALDKRATPGGCIQIYRENLGLTQEELGEKVGVSKQYVSDWEHNRRKVSAAKAKKLAQLFHISVEYLI